jgi:predicted nucleic acid-binding protein
VILVDTGPLVALFDPRDDAHAETRTRLVSIREPLVTTVAVLTEAFHLLDPGSRGSSALRGFIAAGGLSAWFLSDTTLRRCFDLMEQYADHPMDLADASIVTAAEHFRTTKVFTLDRSDFTTYRARIGRTRKSFSLIP